MLPAVLLRFKHSEQSHETELHEVSCIPVQFAQSLIRYKPRHCCYILNHVVGLAFYRQRDAT